MDKEVLRELVKLGVVLAVTLAAEDGARARAWYLVMRGSQAVALRAGRLALRAEMEYRSGVTV
jgi:hypothetical protein